MRAKKKNSTVAGANVKAAQWILAIVIIVACLGATAFLWMFVSAKTQLISVCMWQNNHAKNSPLNTDAVCEYKMLVEEYEQYAIQGTGGVTSRLIKWEDRALLNGRYCTRNVYGATVVVMEDLMDQKINNTDMLLYNFPGREIIKLEVGKEDMDAYKRFLMPGDRVNITAVVVSEKTVEARDVSDGGLQGSTTTPASASSLFDDGTSSSKKDSQTLSEEVVTTEPLFDSIYIADMLNKDGESVLDLMEKFNAMTVTQQAQYASSETWRSRTTPDTLLVALTKEELLRYYKYAERQGVTFRVSLPQR